MVSTIDPTAVVAHEGQGFFGPAIFTLQIKGSILRFSCSPLKLILTLLVASPSKAELVRKGFPPLIPKWRWGKKPMDAQGTDP